MVNQDVFASNDLAKITLKELSAEVGKMLLRKRFTVCTAESLTAGLVSNSIALTPGASKYLAGTVVAYQTQAKRELLKVEPTLLLSFGAVHPEVAWQMASGALGLFGTDCCIATTGFAGGGVADVNDGLVYICVITPKRKLVQEFRFNDEHIIAREEVMELTSKNALKMLIENL
ncbi:MAG: CinA family protein [Candidatus Ancillula sp.]|jgi:PncC family amidohydrolase|nr:CinA family protein [Candidatus Ancillula sp.]